MRTYEFITERSRIRATNTEGLSCSDWITLVENAEFKNKLFEGLDQSGVDYLNSLVSYAVIGTVGQKYVPIFVLLLPDRITCYGIDHLAELKETRLSGELEEYTFEDNKGEIYTWPSTRLTKLSYSKLYLFDDEQRFESFRTAIAIKFEPIIPKADFQ